MASTFNERRSSSGRFLPPDPRVAEPYRFTPQLALRVGILGAITLAVFAALFLRLWALQVLSGDKYLVEAQQNQIRTVRVEAPRGTIVDRNGLPFVTNVPGTAVQLWPADLPEQGRYRIVQRLAALLHVPPSRITKAIEARKGDPLTPITVKTAVPFDRVAYLKEHQQDFPGVSVVSTYLRNYEYRSLAAQILGHVGEISEEELAAKEEEGYHAGDKIGKAGVEGAFDTYLRGTSGRAQLRVDSLGRPQSPFQVQQFPAAGNGVRLTLDLHLQRAAERAIQYGIERALENENWWANGGAIVALDPADGEVLALASNPTFKPSVYVGRADPKKLRALTEPGANFPLINRATSGRYPPGSTWKPVTALAAMQEGLLSPYQAIQCTPFSVYGRDRQVFRNWNPNINQAMTLPTALAASCDTFFYELGNRFYKLPARRGQPLQRWARIFGFGEPSGLDVGGDDGGLLPTIRWKRETYTKERYPRSWAVERLWKPGDSIQLAIGQKDLLVTPLQMTRFYALLANGGKLVTPHLVSSVEQPGSEDRPPVVLQRIPPTPPKQTPVSSEAITAVEEGLRAATSLSYGTSVGVFGSFPVPIYGKTGTAEKVVDGVLRDQSWWCGYGPPWGDRSAIALCALIENGGFGGEAAAPAALKVLEAHYGVKATVISEVASD
ncbi:MAG: penicillin-binding protein 2 [Actinobacteria bacterium]|nr:penicillin-binding protein 2 [Actinomycetota bacterium]